MKQSKDNTALPDCMWVGPVIQGLVQYKYPLDIKPNYFKKQSSSSSFLLVDYFDLILIFHVIIQDQTGLEYSAG